MLAYEFIYAYMHTCIHKYTYTYTHTPHTYINACILHRTMIAHFPYQHELCQLSAKWSHPPHFETCEVKHSSIQ